MRILHCITGLSADGAQGMLLRLLRVLDRSVCESRVVSLSAPEDYAGEFLKAGIAVDFLNMRSGSAGAAALTRLSRIIRTFRPDILQGWMYHANVAVSAAALAALSRPAVVWNIRRSLYDRERLKPLTRCLITACALLSHRAHAVIYCAQASAEQHRAAGFAARNAVVIGNGFDLDVLRPLPDARAELRRELELPDSARLVGIVGRYDQSKDYPNFLEAAGAVAARLPDVRFVLIGRGVDESNAALMNSSALAAVRDRVALLGERRDAWKLIAGLDLYCSSSRSEGFPNTVAEALACCVPCVVTNVGASAELVREPSLIVPPRDSGRLADALVRTLELPPAARAELGRSGRRFVDESCSIGTVAQQYARVYAVCLSREPRVVREAHPSHPAMG